MRLQVFLSHSGACSRRKALELILSGHVTVNDKPATEPSLDVDPDSREVKLDGVLITPREKKIYILLHKPQGVVSTVKDAHAGQTVLELLPAALRKGLHPVGRLDKDTTGVLLLTNDGELTHRISHPSFEVEKTYEVLLNKDAAESDLKAIGSGVMLEGRKTAPCRVKKLSPGKLEIILHEGRKRQIRRVFSLFHYHVKELKRVRQGSLDLGGLKEGEWRFLEDSEVRRLFQDFKFPPFRHRP
ncbi:MAG: pseudouridine synthase [Candidatus Omnitrophota bacterium]